MTFLHTSLFLAGLACVALPILIHLLLRQRRKPIQWGAMRFLIEAYRKHRRRLRLQQWLLLACRCLVIFLLAAAIARPLLERAGLLSGSSGRAIYLVIDNSLAAQLTSDSSPQASSPTPQASSPPQAALSRHIAAAQSILDSLGPGDRAGLITLGGPAELPVVPASSDLAAVRELVGDLRPTDSAADLAGALEQLGSTLSRDDAGAPSSIVLVVLSDFLAGSADLSRPLPPALRDLPPGSQLTVLALPPTAASAGNVQITSVDPLRPVVLTGSGGVAPGEQVRLTLRRSGSAVSDAASSTVRVRVITPGTTDTAGRPLAAAQTTIRWQPGQTTATATVQVDASTTPGSAGASGGNETPGAASVIIAEIDRDALPADDSFRKPIGVREALRVGIIAQRRFGLDRADRLAPADWITLALQPTTEAPMDIAEIEPAGVDQPTLANLDVVFLPAPDLLPEDAWQRLRRFADQGGMVIVTPPTDATVHLWTDALIKSMSLPWRIARETTTAPQRLSDERPDSPIWSRLAAEMETLAKPVGILKTLAPEPTGRETEVLLSLAGGVPWMIAAPPGSASSAAAPDISQPSENSGGQAVDTSPTGRGLVVYLASAFNLGWTDLPAKPLMVPLMQELVRQGFGRAAGSWSTVAGRRAAAPGRATVLRPTETGTNENNSDVDDSGLSKQPIRRSGLWQAVDAAGRARGIVAVNADAAGGRVEPQEQSAIQAWLGSGVGVGESGDDRRVTLNWLDRASPAAALSRDQGGSPVSLPLLAAALALALLETALARWFSHARVAPSANSASLAAPQVQAA